MKQFLLLLLFSCCFQWTNAAINPIYKHCIQRGYTVGGDYCIFPDSTQCLLTAFNEQTCGVKWFTQDYCIPEGVYVWDADKCCEGLVAYLPPGVAGQATCRSKKELISAQTFEGLSLWTIALVLLFLCLLLFLLKRTAKRAKS